MFPQKRGFYELIAKAFKRDNYFEMRNSIQSRNKCI